METLRYSLIPIRTNACGVIILGAVYIWTIVECSISSPYWSPPSLVEKMPMKTCIWSVLCAFVLQKKRALLRPKFL